MAASLAPVIHTIKAGAAISKGMAVKKGADDLHVVKGAANTDKCFGIAQNAPTLAEDLCEVAVDGGAKGLLGEAVVQGDLLVSGADGRLMKGNTAGDMAVAQAEQDGAENDLIAVLIVHGHIAAAV